MRTLALAFVTVLAAACGVDPAGDDDGMGSGSGSGSGSGEQPAFRVTSKDVVLNPGQEITYCYYFHTPNTEQVVIKKWVSDMTPGSHHMIMYFGGASQPADGTLDPNGCSFGGIPTWIYAAQTPHGELEMPQDDGAGKPLGMLVPPNQAAYFEMHYLNQGDTPLTVHVDLEAYAYAKDVTYTPTAAYITYNGEINIGVGAMNYTETETCGVPAGVQFWTVSTHSHKQSIKTSIMDGSSMVFFSEGPDAWEHPGAQSWMTSPFYTFSTGRLTYSCTYNNPTGRAIEDGQSAATDEMCMATGYIFPMTTAKFCYTNQGPF